MPSLWLRLINWSWPQLSHIADLLMSVVLIIACALRMVDLMKYQPSHCPAKLFATSMYDPICGCQAIAILTILALRYFATVKLYCNFAMAWWYNDIEEYGVSASTLTLYHLRNYMTLILTSYSITDECDLLRGKCFLLSPSGDHPEFGMKMKICRNRSLLRWRNMKQCMTEDRKQQHRSLFVSLSTTVLCRSVLCCSLL